MSHVTIFTVAYEFGGSKPISIALFKMRPISIFKASLTWMAKNSRSKPWHSWFMKERLMDPQHMCLWECRPDLAVRSQQPTSCRLVICDTTRDTDTAAPERLKQPCGAPRSTDQRLSSDPKIHMWKGTSLALRSASKPIWLFQTTSKELINSDIVESLCFCSCEFEWPCLEKISSARLIVFLFLTRCPVLSLRPFMFTSMNSWLSVSDCAMILTFEKGYVGLVILLHWTRKHVGCSANCEARRWSHPPR